MVKKCLVRLLGGAMLGVAVVVMCFHARLSEQASAADPPLVIVSGMALLVVGIVFSVVGGWLALGLRLEWADES